jgi:drug/metabolite transporter (DMT)-like permease
MSKLPAVSQLLLASFLFGASNVAQKAVFTDLDAWSSMGFRGLFAALALLPFVLTEKREANQCTVSVVKASLPVMVWFFFGMTFQLIGATQTSVTNVGFLINTCVIFTPFLNWAFAGTRPSTAVCLSCLLCFAGVVMLSGGTPESFGRGDVFCLLSAMSYAAWIIALGKTMQSAKAPMLVTLLQWVAPAFVGLAVGAGSYSVQAVTNQLPNLLFLGVVTSGLGYVLAARAQQHLPSCTAAVCYSAEAVFGALLAYAWFGETLGPIAMAGAALTLASIVLVQCNPIQFFKSTSSLQVRIEPRFV